MKGADLPSVLKLIMIGVLLQIQQCPHKTSRDLIKLGELHRCFWPWNDGLKATHHSYNEVILSYWPPIDHGMAEIDYIGSNKNMALEGQEI
jgi:hypothetical protein